MRTLFRLLLLFVSLPATAQYHQKLIVTGVSAAPAASGQSYGRIKQYADGLRRELGEENVRLISVSIGNQPAWYRVYRALADSALDGRIREAMGYVPDTERDSVLARFGHDAGSIVEHFPKERDRLLILNRYQVNEEVAVSGQVLDYREIASGAARSTDFFAEEMRSVRAFMDNPFIRVDTAAEAYRNHFGPSAYTSVFHKFQREKSGAEISIFAPQRNDAELWKGTMSLSDMLGQLSGSYKQLITVRVTGEQLKEYLEYNAGIRFFTIAGPDSDLLRPLNYPPADVSGVRYRIDLTRRSKRITIYEMEDGSRFNPRGMYTLVMDSYLARRFERLGISAAVAADDYHIALAGWLLENRELRPRAADNWSAAPERWVKTIADRERRFLFGK